MEMANIEVNLISKHTIKPSASSSLLQPYKLSLLDQLTPAMYFPFVFFYPISNIVFDLPQTLADLREAFSKTLTLYYPLSGRVKNNLYIDDFEAGIPYVEARVKCNMNDFLWCPKIECLHKFVALKPFGMEAVSDGAYPLFGIQVNVFDSGLAIGISVSHKLVDGGATVTLLSSWSAAFRGSHEINNIKHPDLSQAALIFPPRDDLPEKYASLTEEMWFAKKNVVTRRFVFDAKAISIIQNEAKSKSATEPTRVQSVIGFLWKHMIVASQAQAQASDTTSARLFGASQSVQIRSKMNSDTPLDNAIGNLIWWPTAMVALNHKAQDKNDLKLCDLVNLLNESVKQCNSDYLKTFTGKEGYESMCEYLDMLKLTSSTKPAPEIFTFTSLTTFFGRLDFGWGKPSFIGVDGKTKSSFFNSALLVSTKCNTEIEAWVNLEEAKMAMLEKDPHFIKFTSSNHPISRF